MDLRGRWAGCRRPRYRASPRAKAAALARLAHAGLCRGSGAGRGGAGGHAGGPRPARPRHRRQPGLSRDVPPPRDRRRGGHAGGRAAGDGGAVHVPGGGTHHAFPDRATGSATSTIRSSRSWRCGGTERRRVAYVDIDAHHPDGVEAVSGTIPRCCWSPPTRRGAGRGPGLWGRGGGERLQPAGAARLPRRRHGPGERRLILLAVAAFRPMRSSCNRARTASRTTRSRGSRCRTTPMWGAAGLRPLAPRLMLLGGGGYNPWAVGRCWTRLWGALAGEEGPDRLPPAARGGAARPPTGSGGAGGRRVEAARGLGHHAGRPVARPALPAEGLGAAAGPAGRPAARLRPVIRRAARPRCAVRQRERPGDRDGDRHGGEPQRRGPPPGTCRTV